MRSLWLIILLFWGFISPAQLVLGKNQFYGGTVFTAKKIVFSLDYSQNIKALIASGKYDFVDTEIDSNYFPNQKKFLINQKRVVARIFHFDSELSTEIILAKIKLAGYRPATLLELLALDNVAKISFQGQHPIIALGSLIRCQNDSLVAPCLNIDCLSNTLDLYWLNGTWDQGCYFLAIKKSFF